MIRKINISEYSDFCFGVKRAVSLAESALRNNPGPVYSLGPLIHNRQVVNEFSEKGLDIIMDYRKIKMGTALTSSHGIHPRLMGELKKRGIKIIDAACPIVKNAHILAKRLSEDGYRIIIIGDKGHPEVKSLRGFAGNKSLVVTSKEEAKRLKLKESKVGVIAQTTQSLTNFLEVMSELLKKGFAEIKVFNTICRDVNMRQKSTERFSKDNDVVLVVGGKNSANTKRLYEICRAMGTQAHHIETGSEVRDEWIKNKRRIGVVSGASTPRWVVDDVVKRLQSVK